MEHGFKTLTIVHFNDVYNLEESSTEPVGGAARFVTAVQQFADRKPLIFFSGDGLSPSFLGQPWKGKHMIPVLNRVGVHSAVVGNHDLDFGVDVLIERARESKFSWLLSNCVDNTTGEPLADAKEVEILEWNGLRIGLIGLVDPSWLSTLGVVDSQLLTIQDVVSEANELSRMLKSERNCDLVFALTHALWSMDEELAEKCDPESLDLILGGHDHDYGVRQFKKVTPDGYVRNLTLVKSGSDFRDFSVISLRIDDVEALPRQDDDRDPAKSKVRSRLFISNTEIERVTVTSRFAKDEETVKQIETLIEASGAQANEVVCELDADLDATFESIRSKETKLANFICDIMLEVADADIALLNSGSLRADKVFPKGPFRIRNLQELLPFPDIIVVLLVSGQQLYEALENSVSLLPGYGGCFAAVSGMRFAYHVDRQPGSRVDPCSIMIGDTPLVLDQEYKLSTLDFVADGKDGFTMFTSCKRLVDEENGTQLLLALLNHFRSCEVLEGKVTPLSSHRQSTVPRVLRKQLESSLTSEALLAGATVPDQTDDSTRISGRFRRKVQHLTRLISVLRQKAIFDYEKQHHHGPFESQVGGRICPLQN